MTEIYPDISAELQAPNRLSFIINFEDSAVSVSYHFGLN